jgi:hypothetical protein
VAPMFTYFLVLASIMDFGAAPPLWIEPHKNHDDCIAAASKAEWAKANGMTDEQKHFCLRLVYPV